MHRPSRLRTLTLVLAIFAATVQAAEDDRLQKARSLAKDGKHAAAIQILDGVLDKEPAHVDALLLRAESHLALRRYNEAFRDASEVFRTQADHPQARLIRGIVRMRQMDLEQAVEELEQAVKGLPKHAEARFYLAGCLLMRHRLDEAVKELEAVVKLDPKFAPAHVALAKIRFQQDKRDDAIKILTEARRHVPENAEIRKLLDDAVRQKTKEDEEAARRKREEEEKTDREKTEEQAKELAAVKEAIAADPENIALQVRLAITLSSHKRTKEAIALYQEIIKKDPRVYIAYNNLAWIYITETKDLKKAEPLAMKALELAPDDPAQSSATLDTVAWLYYLTDRVPKALPLAQKALTGESDNAELRYHLGMIYHKLKQNGKAAEELRTALKLDPKIPQKDEIEKVLKAITPEKP